MRFSPDVKARIAATLNKLSFVTWDRFVDGGEYVSVYGWIDRDDGNRDFILADFSTDGEYLNFTTSSATWSREATRIFHGTDEGHTDCESVWKTFGNAVGLTTRWAA